ncbi:hypothetical protein L596_025999 [Steinernema carpocapsae]|uniref:Uncharacterized protein n=1 Tax=Steinernema carpocapsae TaxID=34508 RepID=A0A4V5ZY25_STECR|nr:hypothetical protein L596_025999 [Steinernema carpocapsae]
MGDWDRFEILNLVLPDFTACSYDYWDKACGICCEFLKGIAKVGSWVEGSCVIMFKSWVRGSCVVICHVWILCGIVWILACLADLQQRKKKGFWGPFLFHTFIFNNTFYFLQASAAGAPSRVAILG